MLAVVIQRVGAPKGPRRVGPDGAWDRLDFSLEPYEAPNAVFQGAAMSAIAAGSEGRDLSEVCLQISDNLGEARVVDGV